MTNQVINKEWLGGKNCYKKVEAFIPVAAFRYIMFVRKIFLADLFAEDK